MVTAGKVWLVGAGPGDPGLLTLKGARVLGEAQAVVYDRLANPVLLEHLPAECERIYAGKEPGAPALTQPQINERLVQLAQEGKRVVRLKGGDPFVFGRGGEEAEALRAAGIAFEVVPGISSAIAVPAYAGIPVSHRGVATSFAVLTGHEDPAKPESSIHWRELATGTDTLICLMGVESLPEIMKKLVEAGRSPQTPVAVTRWGTLPRQQTVTGTLADIVERTRAADFGPPAVTVIGEVVRLRDQLEWFETRPLFGLRVLITRTRQQASGLRALLEEEGAEVIELPTLELVDGASPQLLDRVVEALADGEYAWVVFTSANGVRRFFHSVHEAGRDARAFRDSKVAVIGPGTAEALAEFGIRPDAMPQEYVGEALAGVFSSHELARRRVLVPRAEGAREELVRGLRALGAEVEEVPLYNSEVPRSPDPTIVQQIQAGAIDVVTFASSSAVRNLVKMLGGEIDGLRRAAIACIGPITAQTAERCGLSVAVQADDHSIPGLVAALRQHLGGSRQ
jgi:uroporphyrinogen III methyltransferase/synthase